MQEKTHLAEGCYIVSGVEDGDVFGVGGSMFGGEPTAFVKVDYATLSDLFTGAQQAFSTNDLDALAGYGRSINVGCEDKSFAQLYLLQKILEKHVYPQAAKNEWDRVKFYGNEQETLLSDAVNASHAACVEMSLIAAKMLMDQGRTVHMFSGAFVGDEIEPGGDAYNSPHTFLVVEEDATDNVLIFDPANPINTDRGQFPAIFVVPIGDYNRFLDVGEQKAAFLRLREEVFDRIKYYGVDAPNVNFVPDHHVFDPNAMDEGDVPIPPGQ